jgi:hypothetical protein
MEAESGAKVRLAQDARRGISLGAKVQIGAKLLCKGECGEAARGHAGTGARGQGEHESIEYGVSSIGAHDEGTRTGGHVGRRSWHLGTVTGLNLYLVPNT